MCYAVRTIMTKCIMGKEKMIYKHQRDTHYNKSKKQKKQEWKGERRNNEKREDKGKNEMETGGL